jgi:coenzyme F420-0:L-glutamate ligase / coenzyme F420-1:gamma-L-glutamate ligase
VRARTLPGLPEVRPGDDLAALLVAANGGPFAADEVVVVAQKVVSKAEGRVLALADVVPSAAALALAAEHDKDPRLVEVVLAESAEVVRARRGVLICRTRQGYVCANAGVDRSNTGGEDLVVLLPEDPDGSARALRAALPGRPAVVVTDSFGRAWRVGQAEVAIGVAGLVPVEDWAGRPDADGRPLQATAIAVADQAASAADLARAGKAAREPAVVLEGLGRWVTAEDGPGATALVRARAEDLFA